MKLYIARHGLTNYNELHLCNNDPTVDVFLTEKGIRQAQHLAESLKEVPIEVIYTSELKRTIQTATYVNEFHNLKIIPEAVLNDTVTGYEGQPVTDYTDQLDNSENRWTAKFNGGESLNDLKNRVRIFIDNLSQQDYESVLIVTSQYIIFAFLYWLDNLTNEEAWSSEVMQGDYTLLELPKYPI
jgi:broad specificity phosphatase PhoE